MIFTELEGLVLQTLSFYDSMTLANIILSFESEILKKHPHFSQADLEDILIRLRRLGLVNYSKNKGQRYWLRRHPPRTWYERFLWKIRTQF